jgi:hypothetical protein
MTERHVPEFNLTGSLNEMITRSVDHLLDRRTSIHVVVGPVVWQLKDDGKRLWYFVVATGDANGFRCDQIGSDSQKFASQSRAAVIVEITQRRPPLVIHDLDDELEMAKWCEVIWPGETTRQIRTGIEAERRSAR